jgi:hypothetical protein
VRNYINKGNPFFPFSYKGGKSVYLEIKTNKLPISDPPDFALTASNVMALPWTMTMNEPLSLGSKKLGVIVQESMPGPIFLLLLPLVLLFINKVPRPLRILQIYAAAGLLLWVVLGKAYLRYCIPCLPFVGLIVGSLIFESQISRFFKQAVAFVIVLMGLGNTLSTMAMQKSMRDPVNLMLGLQSRDEFISTQRPGYPCPYYPALSWANTHLPSDAKILFLGESRGYFSQRKFIVYGVGEKNPLVEMCSRSKNADELYQKLRGEGVTHILLNMPEARRLATYEIFYFEPEQLALFNEFWKKYVKEVYKGIGDIAIPERGVISMRQQVPDWWQQYSSEPRNFVYLYELMSDKDANIPHEVPLNFMTDKTVYSPAQWEKLRVIAERSK